METLEEAKDFAQKITETAEGLISQASQASEIILSAPESDALEVEEELEELAEKCRSLQKWLEKGKELKKYG